MVACIFSAFLLGKSDPSVLIIFSLNGSSGLVSPANTLVQTILKPCLIIRIHYIKSEIEGCLKIACVNEFKYCLVGEGLVRKTSQQDTPFTVYCG